MTDFSGNPVAGVVVKMTGTTAREGKTDANGALSFANLRAGAVRLHFEHERFVTLERDVTVRASGSMPVDVTLTAAPPPPKPDPPPPAPVPVKPAITRTTERPRTTNVPNFIEANFIGRSEPRKDSNVACMGTATGTLIQLRDPIPEDSHANADEMLYVVAGEATLKVSGKDEVLEAGAFSTVPMGTTYSLTRRGRNPVVILSIVSGEPCRSAEAASDGAITSRRSGSKGLRVSGSKGSRPNISRARAKALAYFWTIRPFDSWTLRPLDLSTLRPSV